MVAHWKPEPPNSVAISCTVAACSATLALLPWNSISSIGASVSVSLSCRFTARTACVSSNSQRAIGMPIWMIWIVVRTAASMLGKVQVAAEIASGSGYSRSVISVITPSVPSLPTISRVRS